MIKNFFLILYKFNITWIVLTSRVEISIFFEFEHTELDFWVKPSQILLSSSSICCLMRYLFRVEYFFEHKLNKHEFKSNRVKRKILANRLIYIPTFPGMQRGKTKKKSEFGGAKETWLWAICMVFRVFEHYNDWIKKHLHGVELIGLVCDKWKKGVEWLFFFLCIHHWSVQHLECRHHYNPLVYSEDGPASKCNVWTCRAHWAWNGGRGWEIVELDDWW